MTREQRHAILGPRLLAWCEQRVKAAPEPSDEVIEKLRRIMTNPAGEVPDADWRGGR